VCFVLETAREIRRTYPGQKKASCRFVSGWESLLVYRIHPLLRTSIFYIHGEKVNIFCFKAKNI